MLVLPDEPEDKSEEAMAAWQQECDEVRAQFKADQDAWAQACLQAYVDYADACRAWKEEHDRIEEEYYNQLAAYEKWDEETAVAEWQAAREADAAPYLQRLVRIKYRIIRGMEERIVRNARNLYRHKLANGNSTKLVARCNDFLALEQACKTYR